MHRVPSHPLPAGKAPTAGCPGTGVQTHTPPRGGECTQAPVPGVPPRAVRFLCINPHSTAASFRGKKTHEANRKENQPSVLTTADF